MSVSKESTTSMSSVLDPAAAANHRPNLRPGGSEPDDRSRRHSGEIRKLPSPPEVSQPLPSPPNLKSAFHRVLEILERYHGTSRSVIALPRDDGRRLHLHASIGVRAQHSDTPLGGR